MAVRWEGPLTLFAAASTGNATSTVLDVDVPDMGATALKTLAIQFEVEAVGGTPTATVNVKGTLDGTNFFNVGYSTEAVDTVSAAAVVVTAVGRSIFYIDVTKRPLKQIEVVVSANTNVTYNTKLWRIREA